MHDDRAVEAGEDVGRVGVRVARVDDDGLAELGRELELRLEEAALPVARRVVAEVVEAGLPDCDRSVVLEQARAARRRATPRRRRPDAGRCRARRTPPRGGRRARAPLGTSRCPVPTVTIRSTPAARARRISADGRSAHASRCAWVSITPAARRPAPASGRAPRRRRCSGSSFLNSGLGFGSAWPGASSLGAQLPIHALVVAGQHLVRRRRRSPTSRSSSGPAIVPSLPSSSCTRLRRERQERQRRSSSGCRSRAARRRAPCPARSRSVSISAHGAWSIV